MDKNERQRNPLSLDAPASRREFIKTTLRLAAAALLGLTALDMALRRPSTGEEIRPNPCQDCKARSDCRSPASRSCPRVGNRKKQAANEEKP